MSHFATYQCPIDNKDYIIKALDEMGFDVMENCTITDWAQQHRKVDLGLVSRESGQLLSVGFIKKDEQYEIVADWFGFMPEKVFTERLAQLHDKYRVLDMLEGTSWNVTDIVENENGEIEILATSWS